MIDNTNEMYYRLSYTVCVRACVRVRACASKFYVAPFLRPGANALLPSAQRGGLCRLVV